MTSRSIADDVTITRQLWRDHVNNDIYISSLLTAVFMAGRVRTENLSVYKQCFYEKRDHLYIKGLTDITLNISSNLISLPMILLW